MSDDTTGSAIIPRIGPVFCAIASFSDSVVTERDGVATRSIQDTLGQGTRTEETNGAKPRSGSTSPISFEALVVVGTMETAAARARSKPPFGVSVEGWDAV